MISSQGDAAGKLSDQPALQRSVRNAFALPVSGLCIRRMMCGVHRRAREDTGEDASEKLSWRRGGIEAADGHFDPNTMKPFVVRT